MVTFLQVIMLNNLAEINLKKITDITEAAGNACITITWAMVGDERFTIMFM